MRNKLYLLAGAAVLLFLAFFLIEENKEDVNEIQYWKFPIDRVEYFPPSSEWLEKTDEKFFNKPFTISVQDGIRKGGKFFVVSNLDQETGKNIQFEGGYNSENTIRDFGVFRVKSTEPVAQGISIKDSLYVGEDSPKLVIYSGNQSRTLRIGRKHFSNSTRIVLDAGTSPVLLTVSSYLFDRFQKGPDDFRLKALLSLNKEYIKEISYIDESGKSIRVDNTPYEEKNIKKNFWRRLSGAVILIDPRLGEELYRSVTSLKVELFPDSADGAGFGVGTILAPDSNKNEFSLASLKVLLSDGNEIIYRFHMPTTIGEKKLSPVVRIVNGSFKEPPFYIVEESLLKIQHAVSKIQDAKQIVKPAKKNPKKAAPRKQ
ncbi:DUF4340 domain-containing protein [Leptospira langatensis]|uniref:DUF4340 domain-containing protein n=1 Tax=Leptospira langatensis TaxID=2484983 RepID=A0A5F1ZW32_9LEPT|nr:DUF4340 domain-containing protein [Leptospira langatensis]TGK01492.1 DUF4340 domain-containing protein [Leptospira langatensis]TGL42058.1 DUF4340 domain-containing protein [Leptospira langatensis]